MKITQFILCALALALTSCTGFPGTFSAGFNGTTKDGTGYHAEVNVPLGKRVSSGKAVVSVQ